MNKIEPLEVINHLGHDIKIYPDYDCGGFDTPNDWDPTNVCLIYDHRDFSVFPTINGVKLTPGDAYAMFETWQEHKAAFGSNEKWQAPVVNYGGVDFWLFAVFAYIHSGVALYLSRKEASQFEPTGFDTSFKGFCLVSKNEYSDPAKAMEIAKAHLNDWNCLNNGDVYGYTCEYTGESCWGFYGESGKIQAIEEAKAEIEHKFKEECKSRKSRGLRSVKELMLSFFRYVGILVGLRDTTPVSPEEKAK